MFHFFNKNLKYMFIYFFSILQTMKMQVLVMLQRYRLVSHLRLYLKAKKHYICACGQKRKKIRPLLYFVHRLSYEQFLMLINRSPKDKIYKAKIKIAKKSDLIEQNGDYFSYQLKYSRHHEKKFLLFPSVISV